MTEVIYVIQVNLKHNFFVSMDSIVQSQNGLVFFNYMVQRYDWKLNFGDVSLLLLFFNFSQTVAINGSMLVSHAN